MAVVGDVLCRPGSVWTGELVATRLDGGYRVYSAEFKTLSSALSLTALDSTTNTAQYRPLQRKELASRCVIGGQDARQASSLDSIE